MADFETKDSWERKVYGSWMQRDTSENKPRFDLLFPKSIPYKEQMITRFAEIMMRWAKKYNERNREKANTSEELDRAKESALRHMMQWICGEEDEDHAAAVYYNIMLAEYVKFRIRTKDHLLSL